MTWRGREKRTEIINACNINKQMHEKHIDQISLSRTRWSQYTCNCKWAPSSEFVSSSTPSWQILTAHAQPFRGARDLAFCLKVPLDSLFVWASSGGSGETARMRRLAWTFAARICDKYQIRLTRSKYESTTLRPSVPPGTHVEKLL